MQVVYVKHTAHKKQLEALPAGVWRVDLINEQDGAICIFAKLILCVHQYEASLCSLLLTKLEQRKGSLADLHKTKPSMDASHLVLEWMSAITCRG